MKQKPSLWFRENVCKNVANRGIVVYLSVLDVLVQ